MAIKKSLSLDAAFTDRTFHERFDLAREAGFDQVEFGAWTELDISLVAEKLRANRLQLAAMAGANRHALAGPAGREYFLEFLSQSIAVAKSFGCGNLLVPFDRGPIPSGNPSVDYTCIAAAARVLLDGAKKADRAGMTLHLQPAGEGDAGATPHAVQFAAEVVKAVGSPALRMLYPLFPLRKEESRNAAGLHSCKDLVGYVHVDFSHGADGPADPAEIGRLLAAEPAYDGVVGFVCDGAGGAEGCIEWAKRLS